MGLRPFFLRAVVRCSAIQTKHMNTLNIARKTIILLCASFFLLLTGQARCDSTYLLTPAFAGNRVLALDGNGSYVQIPDASNLQNPSEITLEAWICAKNDPEQRNVLWMSNGDGQSRSSQRGYEYHWKSNYFYIHAFFNAPTNFAVIAIPAASDQWIHIAATYISQEGLFTVYTNGLFASSTNLDFDGGSLAGLSLRQTTLPLCFGMDTALRTTATGYMDEVRIWTRARSQAEIRNDYARRLNGNEPGLAGYWNFDDGTATDATGQGRDGVFYGNAQTVLMDLPPYLPLTISRVPNNQATTEGGEVTFSVEASGKDPLNFQWLFDGMPIAGAVSSSLTLTNIQVSQSGTYQVGIADTAGAYTNLSVLLTVLSPANRGSNQPPASTYPLPSTEGLMAAFRLDGTDPALYIEADKAAYVANRFGEAHQAMMFPQSGYTGSLVVDYFKNRHQWSWAGWIKPSKAESAWQTFYSEGNQGLSGYLDIHENRVVVGLWNEDVADNWTSTFSPPIIKNDQWQHVAVTFDAPTNETGVCQIYVNGKLVASCEQPMEKATDAFRASHREFCFGDYNGAYTTSGNHYYYYGAVDDVFIYGRVLSESEINGLLHSPNGLLKLDGSDGYLSVADSSKLQFSNAVTVASWIYPVAGTNNRNTYFISKGGGLSIDSSKAFDLCYTPDRRAFFSIYTGVSTWSLLAASIPELQWTHIAATFDSSSGWFRLYTNGVLADATTNDVTRQYSLKGEVLRQNHSPLVFGCSWDTTPLQGTFATGQMDDILLWKKALSSQEIRDLVGKRCTESPSSLMAEWNFDTGIPKDGSGQDQDGVLVGHASIAPMTGFDILHDVIGFNSASFDRRGQIVLEVAARNGAMIQIDASTNLIDWVSVTTVPATDGSVQFTDPDTLDFNQRFYRAVLIK